MSVDRLQLQRLELKYLISEEKAQIAREFVRTYLSLDEYGAKSPDLSYEIHSLYLDSDILTTYWWTVNGNKNRFKLRIRFYDNSYDTPAFLEIKRRMNEAILKQRAPIRKEVVGQIFEGQLPPYDSLYSTESRYLIALHQFYEYVSRLRAKPKAHVCYRREAWITTYDNSIRITFDRAVKFEPKFELDFSTKMDAPVYPFHPWVVLEIKFTGRFPNWIGEMVHALNLKRCAASKYCDGVATVGENFFYEHARMRGVDVPPLEYQPQLKPRKRERVIVTDIAD